MLARAFDERRDSETTVEHARISRVRSEEKPKPCWHGRRRKRAYDEQRERGKRSFTSLLIGAVRAESEAKRSRSRAGTGEGGKELMTSNANEGYKMRLDKYFLNRGMGTKNVVHLYNGVLLSY